MGQPVDRIVVHDDQMGRLTARAGIALLLILGSLTFPGSSATAFATDDFPDYQGGEWTELVAEGLSRLPGLTPPGAPGAITGNSRLDNRIWAIAFSRGYRMRPIATGGLVTQDGHRMQPATAAAWEALQAEAARHGHRLAISSAYRSISTQRAILIGKLGGTSDAAIDAALRYSAPPGASIHHTGYALDLKVAGGTIGGFAGTAAYRWLSANNYFNAKRFGFAPSYPPGAHRQGPVPEPWEFTYVGVDLIRCGIEGGGTGSVLTECPRLAALVEGSFDGAGAGLAWYDGRDGAWWVSRSTGSGFSTTRWARYSTRSGWQTHLAGDFTGDGKADLASFHPSNGTWWVSVSTGTGFTLQKWDDFSTANGWAHQIAADFDGDGTHDIAQYHPASGTWWVSRSTGSGFTTTRWARYSTRSGWQTHLAGDFTGDGKADLASFHPSNGTWWVSRSTGTGFSLEKWDDFSTANGWAHQIAADFDGDGTLDIAQYHPGNDSWWIGVSNGRSFLTRRWN